MAQIWLHALVVRSGRRAFLRLIVKFLSFSLVKGVTEDQFSKIVGGEVASVTKYPFVASLRLRTEGLLRRK